MSAPSCPQEPLVDASEDGRLSPADRASIERHVAVCGACATRLHANERIRAALRAPAPEATELEHLRARGALLRAASLGGPAEAPKASRAVRFAYVAMAAAFFVATLSVGWVWGHASSPSAARSAAPSAAAPKDASVVPSEGARFERTRGGGIDTVTLSSGALAIVTGTTSGERLVVHTKDAELEAKDGAFHVEADDGHIRNVIVERGTVEVRYAGFIAVIPGGGSWHGGEATAANVADAAAPSALPAASVAIAPPAPATAPAAPVAMVAQAPVRTTPAKFSPDVAPAPAASASSSTDVPAAAPPPPPPPRAGGVFSSAMRTLERGDYDGAALSLGAFADAHPDDPRSDDAEYVRAIALQRAGHLADAKAAAAKYLATRPDGAHRREAMQIVGK